MDELTRMEAKVSHLEALVNLLISEARFNNRITILAICVLAGAEKVISLVKVAM